MNRDQHQNAPENTAATPSQTGRRRFLQLAAASGIALPCGGAIAHAVGLGESSDHRPASPLWEIEAARVEQTFGDGSTVPFFRYRALGSTPVAGTVPVLTGRHGQVARLRVNNTLSRGIRPTIVGGTPGPWIDPGTELTFELPLPPMGTWLLTDHELGDAAGPMGLGAVIISRLGASVRRGGLQSMSLHRYDREYVLFYVDSDDRWNTAIDAGQPPDFGYYEPNYHTVNNLTFPDTVNDPGTMITCRVGERVLLRLCNLGWVRQAIHFHGYHVTMQRINNQGQSIYGPKDTIPLPGHTTAEILLEVNQPGLFPVHPHSLTTTTDNGLYAGGQITLINAT
jgi:FtsP/CotA-like multicopper oxidase with cupredoxin domain